MATKRQAVAQIPAADFELIAKAAEAGAKTLEAKEAKRVKRAAKALRTVSGGK